LLPALILTIILIPVFWVLIIRPQQVRQREHLDVVETLVVGERIESFSGIHGTIVEVGDTTVRVEIADGVVVTMARLAISSRVDEGGHDDEQDESVHQVSDPAPTDGLSATPNGDQ
jgi:preprotein translocase subunit YajC